MYWLCQRQGFTLSHQMLLTMSYFQWTYYVKNLMNEAPTERWLFPCEYCWQKEHIPFYAVQLTSWSTSAWKHTAPMRRMYKRSVLFSKMFSFQPIILTTKLSWHVSSVLLLDSKTLCILKREFCYEWIKLLHHKLPRPCMLKSRELKTTVMLRQLIT